MIQHALRGAANSWALSIDYISAIPLYVCLWKYNFRTMIHRLCDSPGFQQTFVIEKNITLSDQVKSLGFRNKPLLSHRFSQNLCSQSCKRRGPGLINRQHQTDEQSVKRISDRWIAIAEEKSARTPRCLYGKRQEKTGQAR